MPRKLTFLIRSATETQSFLMFADDGCCNLRPAFFERGCHDFFSDAAAEDAECKRYRQYCPQV